MSDGEGDGTALRLHPGHARFSCQPPRSPRQDLRAMLGDGVFFSVMVGIGETYFPAFVMAVGLGELAAGLITSVPLLAGAVLQLLAPWAVQWLGSYRRFVVLCATIQALSFVPLVAAACLGYISTWAVFVLASIYWGFGMATGPAWNAWAETLVPRPLRPRYFAFRTRLSQAGVLAGFLIGGFSLQWANARGLQLPAFAVLFSIAGLSRFLSSRFLASQTEIVSAGFASQRFVTIPELVSRLRKGGTERLLVYLVAVQFAVYISGPYFNPFMLGRMRLDYGSYVILIAASFLAKMAALPLWGYAAHRWGTRTLLWIGGIGIVPVSGLWIVSQNYAFLLALQFAGGIAWAAYELAMFLLFFETIRKDERTSVLTLYNAANASAMVLGSLVGGALLQGLGEGSDSYLWLFVISSVARAATLGLLVLLPERKAAVEPLGFRILALRPDDASMQRPILASIPPGRPAAAAVAAAVDPSLAEARGSVGGAADERRGPATRPPVVATALARVSES